MFATTILLTVIESMFYETKRKICIMVGFAYDSKQSTQATALNQIYLYLF